MHLYSADRAEPLAAHLAGILSDDPLDPMQPEWMAVPSDGMRRWLLLELARHLGSTSPGAGDGVAANILRAYPSTLRSLVLDGAGRSHGDGGGDGSPDRRPGPWHIDRMVWPLLSVFDGLVASGAMPAFTELPEGASRFTRVRSVADLFDRYHLHRPEMVRAWADPASPFGGLVDGNLQQISRHAVWQPRLWRLLKEVIGEPSPPERFDDILGELERGELDLGADLPERLVLFGFTSLPGPDFLPLLQAVAIRRDVHLFLLEPHRFDRDRPAEAWSSRGPSPSRLRSSDPTGSLVVQPLLRSWGRLPREASVLLADGLRPDEAGVAWVGSSDPHPPRTLLGRLQADIRSDVVSPPAVVDPGDRSIQFHACFGPMREVQVARDSILHLLADRSSGLTEEDVLVVCPNLDSFAPLVEAVFGPPFPPGGDAAARDAPRLRHRIADRSIRSANPVLGATAALLELVSGRFEISRVLDFVSLGPVRERFGLDDADLGVLAGWAGGTNVRWGLDTGHRAGFGLPPTVVGNTWQAAVDRLLMGTAVADGDLDLAIGGVAPFGVDSGDVELLGAFAHILGRLAELVALGAEDGAGSSGHPVDVWLAALRSTCHDLFDAPPRAEWQFEALERILRAVGEAATGHRRDGDVRLDLLDFRRLVEGMLDEEPGRPDFFRGGVTVTSMASLRWVPFRVICVLGLDQDALGSPAPDAADLISDSPRLGDPDPRSESRQWLLEAVLAAQDHLIVVRDGHDVRSNHVVPQAVPAAELFDAVIALCPADERDRWRGHLETDHPRHPFDERCLTPDGLVEGVTWSFDRADLVAAERRRNRPLHRRLLLDHPLDVPHDGVVDLADLHRFLADPVGTFVRTTLQASLPRATDEFEDTLPVEPGGLETYRVGRDLLQARLDGVDDAAWKRVERAKGTLPPGVLEGRMLDGLSDEIDAIVVEASVRGVQPGDPELREVDLTLDDGTRIVGVVPLQLHPSSPGPGRIEFTRPMETHRLRAWLDLMVLVAADPLTPWRSVVVTRPPSRGKPLQPVDLVPADAGGDPAAMAAHALELAVDLYRRGRREPLPLFASYSPSVHAGGSADAEWKGHDGGGDAHAPAVRLVFGDIDVDELEDLQPVDGDPGGRGGRAERYARHLWGTVDSTTRSVP
ncbi:MAG: exodeoxyribonuclease V subunit gamma [Acidimicrobiales bacterium]|jgi:exodeoxyribonuclease V gamma subunit